MGGIEMTLDVILLGSLGMTLLHAVRLERALGRLRHDRASLHDAVADLDSGTRQAESGVARLRDATEQLGGGLSHASALRDDLAYLSERGEVLADRLETLVRAARETAAERATAPPSMPSAAGMAGTPPSAPPRSQAERNLLLALQGRR